MLKIFHTLGQTDTHASVMVVAEQQSMQRENSKWQIKYKAVALVRKDRLSDASKAINLDVVVKFQMIFFSWNDFQ